MREARLLRRVRDPSVVSVHDVGETPDGLPYFVMDLAAGGVLQDRLGGGGRAVHPDDLRAIVATLAGGWARLHRASVVHRDVKPSNLLVMGIRTGAGVGRGAAARPPGRLLARRRAAGHRRPRAWPRTRTPPPWARPMLGGTPRYQAPEQTEVGAPIDARTDVYAATAVVWRVVTGRPPPTPDELPVGRAGRAGGVAAGAGPGPGRPARGPVPVDGRLGRGRAGGGAGSRRRRWRPTAAGRAAAVAAVEAGATCPYKGLAAFQPADAPLFFGRAELVDQLVARLQGRAALVVGGPSGSGKSSLLRAGLLQALAGGALPGSGQWTSCLLTPGAHPLAALQARLAADRRRRRPCPTSAPSGPTPPSPATRCGRRRWSSSTSSRSCSPPVPTGASGRRSSASWRRWRARTRRWCGSVLGVRADFYGECAAHPWLASVINDNHVLVGPMSRSQLRDAIEGPARRVGLRLEDGPGRPHPRRRRRRPGRPAPRRPRPGRDVGPAPGHRAHDRRLRGGRRRGRRHRAHRRPSVGAARSRRPGRRPPPPPPPRPRRRRHARHPAAGPVAEPGRRPGDRPGGVDLRRRPPAHRRPTGRGAGPRGAHPHLGPDGVVAGREPRRAAGRGTGSRPRPGSGSARATTPGSLPGDAAGRGPGVAGGAGRRPGRARGRVPRRGRGGPGRRSGGWRRSGTSGRRRVRRRAVSALAGLAAVAVVASVVALVALAGSRRDARAAREASGRATEQLARNLAALSAAQRDGDPYLATVLAAESVARERPAVGGGPPGAGREPGGARPATAWCRTATRCQVGDALTVVVDPAGRRAVTGNRDGTLVVWDLAGRRRGGPPHRPRRRDPGGGLRPRRVVAGGRQRRRRRVAVGPGTGAPPAGDRLADLGSIVWSVAVSPDGRTVAAATQAGQVWLLDAATGAPVGGGPVASRTGDFDSVAFSPDGATLLAGTGNGEVHVWSLPSRELRFPPVAAHTSEVWELVVEPGPARVPHRVQRRHGPAVGPGHRRPPPRRPLRRRRHRGGPPVEPMGATFGRRRTALTIGGRDGRLATWSFDEGRFVATGGRAVRPRDRRVPGRPTGPRSSPCPPTRPSGCGRPAPRPGPSTAVTLARRPFSVAVGGRRGGGRDRRRRRPRPRRRHRRRTGPPRRSRGTGVRPRVRRRRPAGHRRRGGHASAVGLEPRSRVERSRPGAHRGRVTAVAVSEASAGCGQRGRRPDRARLWDVDGLAARGEPLGPLAAALTDVAFVPRRTDGRRLGGQRRGRPVVDRRRPGASAPRSGPRTTPSGRWR